MAAVRMVLSVLSMAALPVLIGLPAASLTSMAEKAAVGASLNLMRTILGAGLTCASCAGVAETTWGWASAVPAHRARAADSDRMIFADMAQPSKRLRSRFYNRMAADERELIRRTGPAGSRRRNRRRPRPA